MAEPRGSRRERRPQILSLWPDYAAYAWLLLGAALLLLEATLPGAYLLFFGLAALVVGLNTLILGADWLGLAGQVIAFVAVTAASLLIGQDWYRRRVSTGPAAGLNRRTDRLLGRVAVLSEPIVAGRGRVAVEDGWWSVEGPDLPAGSQVRIIGAEGSILRVEPAVSGPPERPAAL